jgi:uncharacterized protein
MKGHRWSRGALTARGRPLRQDGTTRPAAAGGAVLDVSLEGWNIARGAAIGWVPWGSGNKARAKVLGSAGGFFIAVVEASPGYRGDPHVHDHPEFLYVLDGAVRTRGQTLERGDGYAAAAGPGHDDFGPDTGAACLSIFKL